MKAKPGEIWLADLGLAAKVRPVLVVSRYDPDAVAVFAARPRFHPSLAARPPYIGLQHSITYSWFSSR